MHGPCSRFSCPGDSPPRQEFLAKNKKTGGGNGSDNGHAKSAGERERAHVKTYHEGEPFPGRIGRTVDAMSEPAFPVPRPAPKGAPNILYNVLDDVGFGWSSTFGGLVQTPNITKLADNGLRYINSHDDGALLADARACLLTGRNHHSVGMANITELATGFPGYNGQSASGQSGHRRDAPQPRLHLVRPR